MAYEDFYESAIRHWIDGSILEENEEYDNAVCMQGFAAECALKRIMERICSSSNIRKYSHFGEALFQDIVMMLTGDVGLTMMIDPACALRLSQMALSEVLFRDHPERRYFGDDKFVKKDAEDCRQAAGCLIRELAFMRLDGYV